MEPGVDRAVVAPATLPDKTVIVPWDASRSSGLPEVAAEALTALGWVGEDDDGPWAEVPPPVLFDTGPPSGGKRHSPPTIGIDATQWSRVVSNWGCLEVLDAASNDSTTPLARCRMLVQRYPTATFALTKEAALALASDRDLAIASAAAGAAFVVEQGAVEAAKRAWELPLTTLRAFTWVGAADNDVRNVRSVEGRKNREPPQRNRPAFQPRPEGGAAGGAK